MKIAYSTATVVASADQGLVVATVEGVITPALATEIISGSDGWAAVRYAQVVSYEMARLEMGASELFAAALRARQGVVPTALVVDEEQLAMFAEYARMNTERGSLKAAFTSVEAAHRWAVRQVRVGEYWARLGRAQRAGP
jgi:hypothetical protein